MQKFNLLSANRLISIEKADEIAKMTKEERNIFNNQIKKQAAYYMLSVSRAVQSKDYKTAKDILIYIADSCSCIEDPDTEVKYLVQVCCQHLAFIRQMQFNLQQKNHSQAKSLNKMKSQMTFKPIYVFKYNKFKGQFQCDQQNIATVNQNVMFYMSKLNSILFNFQNTQNNNSLVAMMKTYLPYFIMIFLLILVLSCAVYSNFIQKWLLLEQNSFQSQVPITIICSLFLIPLFKIYLKQPVKKDSLFFQKRLGEQILKINQQCAANGTKIKFFMPQGIQINVQVDQQESER